jgi:hypothetical protein
MLDRSYQTSEDNCGRANPRDNRHTHPPLPHMTPIGQQLSMLKLILENVHIVQNELYLSLMNQQNASTLEQNAADWQRVT